MSKSLREDPRVLMNPSHNRSVKSYPHPYSLYIKFFGRPTQKDKKEGLNNEITVIKQRSNTN